MQKNNPNQNVKSLSVNLDKVTWAVTQHVGRSRVTSFIYVKLTTSVLDISLYCMQAYNGGVVDIKESNTCSGVSFSSLKYIGSGWMLPGKEPAALDIWDIYNRSATRPVGVLNWGERLGQIIGVLWMVEESLYELNYHTNFTFWFGLFSAQALYEPFFDVFLIIIIVLLILHCHFWNFCTLY